MSPFQDQITLVGCGQDPAGLQEVPSKEGGATGGQAEGDQHQGEVAEERGGGPVQASPSTP